MKEYKRKNKLPSTKFVVSSVLVTLSIAYGIWLVISFDNWLQALGGLLIPVGIFGLTFIIREYVFEKMEVFLSLDSENAARLVLVTLLIASGIWLVINLNGEGKVLGVLVIFYGIIALTTALEKVYKKLRGGWKSRGWFWVGAALLSISTLFWLLAIWAIVDDPQEIGDIMVSVVFITAIPIGIGIFCLWLAGKVSAVTPVQQTQQSVIDLIKRLMCQKVLEEPGISYTGLLRSIEANLELKIAAINKLLNEGKVVLAPGGGDLKYVVNKAKK